MNIKRYLFVIAFGLISFVSLLFILSTILLALRMQINGFIFPVSFLISLIFEFVICFSWSRKESLIKSSMLVVIVTSFVVFVSVFISSKTYDISFDGMDYQQRAVINLDSGWNPFYEKIQTSDLRSDSFLNSYPKASWYVYSSAYKLFSNIETAKFINILILPLAFIFFFIFFVVI
jgi:hypothetical protein